VKGDSTESLAKPVLAAPPQHSAGWLRQLAVAWLTGETPIERQKTPRWTQKVSQLEADESEPLPVSTF
jgi:hypothetical protein